MVENRGKAIRPVHAPGFGTALTVIPFVLVLAGVRYEWWRYPSPLVVIAVKSVGWVCTAECQRASEWLGRLDKVADNWYAFSRGR